MSAFPDQASVRIRHETGVVSQGPRRDLPPARDAVVARAASEDDGLYWTAILYCADYAAEGHAERPFAALGATSTTRPKAP